MDLLTRLEEAYKFQGRSNCAGFSLFVAGVIPKEQFVDIVPSLHWHEEEHPQPLHYFGDLKLINKPQDGSLVLYRHSVMNNFPRHVGVVVGNFIYSRSQEGKGVPIIPQLLSQNIIEELKRHNIVEFYEPKPLF